MENEEVIKEYLKKPIVTEYGTHNVFCPNCFFREGHPVVWCPTCGTKLIKYTDFSRKVTWAEYILAGLTFGIRTERADTFRWYTKCPAFENAPHTYEQRINSKDGTKWTYFDGGKTKEWMDYYSAVVELAKQV